MWILLLGQFCPGGWFRTMPPLAATASLWLPLWTSGVALTTRAARDKVRLGRAPISAKEGPSREIDAFADSLM
jgi:hypothetical protein